MVLLISLDIHWDIYWFNALWISAMHCGVMWPVGISAVFQRPLAVSYTALTTGKLPAVSAVKGDCERVYHSNLHTLILEKNGRYFADNLHVYFRASYVVGEVFPWGGNSVIFSVCASISRTGVQLHEIDMWLDPRSLNEFYGALMFPKVNIIVTKRRLQVKWSKLRLQWIGLGFELGLA